MHIHAQPLASFKTRLSDIYKVSRLRLRFRVQTRNTGCDMDASSFIPALIFKRRGRNLENPEGTNVGLQINVSSGSSKL